MAGRRDVKEYSYFCVEPDGQSDKAIKTVVNAREQFDKDFSKFDILENKLSLEKVFNSAAMPQKEYPAGRYSRSFVRAQDVIPEDLWRLAETDWQALYAWENGQPGMGRIIADNEVLTESKIASVGENRLSFAKLNTVWYIRVPNDEQGKACFVPPDSKPVTYNDMLLQDFCEYTLRIHNRQGLEATPGRRLPTFKIMS